MVPGQELNETSTAAAAASSAAQTTTTTIPAPVPTTVETNVLQSSAPVCAINQEIIASTSSAPVPLAAGNLINARPGSMVRVPEMTNGSKLTIYLTRIKIYFIDSDLLI